MNFVGTDSFAIYAAPAKVEGTTVKLVYTYVITVLQSRPGLLPFPATGNWPNGYAIPDDMMTGVLEANQDLIFNLKAPGAKEAFVQTEGRKQTNLKEVDYLWNYALILVSLH